MDMFKSVGSVSSVSEDIGEKDPLVKESTVKINEDKNEEISVENVVVGQSEQDPKSNEDYEDYDSERDSLMSEPSFEEVILKDQKLILLQQMWLRDVIVEHILLFLTDTVMISRV